MPDGTTLEAHSGYGNRLDDPHHVGERMRGATPPTVYDLKLRESLFHGVQAIRLIPEDEDKAFGRSGLLAHTYMLGPNGGFERLRVLQGLQCVPAGLFKSPASSGSPW